MSLNKKEILEFVMILTLIGSFYFLSQKNIPGNIVCLLITIGLFKLSRKKAGPQR
jgi:hypothetical protein